MGNSKPVLGYPSITAAVTALRAQGLGAAEIARRIGVRTQVVHVLSSKTRRQREPGEQRTVLFPVDLLERLTPHAMRRGIGANELARRLVETAVDDGMIDAILDDAEAA